MTTLITGGAGYIGSHAALRLLADGGRVVIADNLCRGHAAAVEALAGVLPRAERGRLVFEKADVSDAAALSRIAAEHHVERALHFAALTYVGESVGEPLDYWRANLIGTHALLWACKSAGIKRVIFSSTAATFGEPSPEQIPIRETTPQRPINPYGASKLAAERLICDFAHSQKVAGVDFAAAFLRYFNVAGADPLGRIGEDHRPETHLIPIILQCMLGLRPAHNNTLSIFGTDYPTPDGTCIRDYVHVSDLVDAHVRVLDALKPGEVRAYNVGSGKGFSVRQVIDAAERVTGRTLNVSLAPRREGDPATLYADAALITRELGWSPQFVNLDDMIAHAWAWFQAHPNGYG
ncbi:MAG: UDP-glucose 4-epimerase GalE [bacterium]